MQNRTPHQDKIIKRYYQNFDAIKYQRLCDIVTELYLAEERKRERLWKQASEVMKVLGLPESRIEHLLDKKDPALLATVLKELDGKG